MTDAAARAARPGEVIFARYAYPPNELGYCGAEAGREWLHVAGGAVPVDRPIAERARGFEGAWPYLEFLASAGGVADPLHPLVVSAYWVGNELLDAVAPASFAAFARAAFGAQPGADWACLAAGVPQPVPHHAFHVFAVYPWLGLLRRTGSPHALQVLDRCRIRWGTVTSIAGDELTVRSRPLAWDGGVLGLGAPRLETARWADSGRSLLPAVAPGRHVSLHWGWVCDVLDGAALDALRSLTRHQLVISNRVGAGAAGGA